MTPSTCKPDRVLFRYFENDKKPLTNWLTIEIFGVLLGGFISGALSGRLKLKVEKSPGSTTRGGGFSICLL
ncbi:MAG: hypothetical protein R2758_11825 [Bacteroidales bacterium]